MAEERTAEQIAADDGLTTAIEELVRAYYPDVQMNLLTDYMVLGALSGVEGDSLIFSHPRDGELPMYRQVGLVEYVQIRHRGHIMEPDDDE